MKAKALFFLFLSAAMGMHVFAKGKADAGAGDLKTQNDEWVLCITSFNVSSLYAEKTNISAIVARNMVERFNAINFRSRISPEYAYYEDHAWTQSRSAAAKSLSAKMDERSSKIYLGEPEWKYRREIAKLDNQINDLRLKLEEVENAPPLINKEPVFKLTKTNTDLSFPAAPASGAEVKFCKDQKVDAFITGSITDFHGRYFLSVKLYTIFTRSFVWEDNIMFSHDDLSGALEELLLKMIIVLSGNKPSAIAIAAEPENALVLINKSFAGKGDTAVMEYPAGKVTITASAPEHDSLTFETEILPGELAVINIKLNPIEYGELQIMGEQPKSNVYHGALYVGEAPLTLRLPINRMEYIEVKSSRQEGSTVFQTPEYADFNNSLSVPTKVPPRKGHVDRARRHYYWAWGGTWIAGIAAWISYYTYMNINFAMNSDITSNGDYNNDFYSDYSATRNIFYGTGIALGVISVYGIYRMFKYIGASSKGTVPAAAAGRKK